MGSHRRRTLSARRTLRRPAGAPLGVLLGERAHEGALRGGAGLALRPRGDGDLPGAVRRGARARRGAAHRLRRGGLRAHQGHRGDHAPRRESPASCSCARSSSCASPGASTSGSPPRTSTTWPTRVCCAATSRSRSCRCSTGWWPGSPISPGSGGPSRFPRARMGSARRRARLARRWRSSSRGSSACAARLAGFRFSGKLNGATGNWSALHAVARGFDWIALSRSFVGGLDLDHNFATTQIEDHDTWAEYFNLVRQVNNVLLDLDQDVWLYLSLGCCARWRAGARSAPRRCRTR